MDSANDVTLANWMAHAGTLVHSASALRTASAAVATTWNLAHGLLINESQLVTAVRHGLERRATPVVRFVDRAPTLHAVWQVCLQGLADESVQLRAMVLCLIDLFGRPSDLARLSRDSVQWTTLGSSPPAHAEHATVRVRGDKQHVASRAPAQLGAAVLLGCVEPKTLCAACALRAHLQDSHVPLVLTHRPVFAEDARAISTKVKAFFTRQGLAFPVYALRGLAASTAVQAGAPLQQALIQHGRWRSLSTYVKHYAVPVPRTVAHVPGLSWDGIRIAHALRACLVE